MICVFLSEVSRYNQILCEGQSYLFLQLVIFYPREALVKVGWWLWSSADVVWYGRVLDCASPGFRGFRFLRHLNILQ